MSDQEINIAIAKDCGWEHKQQAPKKHGHPMPWLADYWRHSHLQDFWKRRTVPRNYTSDLNDIQEAINTLSGEEYISFCIWLVKIVGNADDALTASARQRAEAFLRTIGKWEEAAK